MSICYCLPCYIMSYFIVRFLNDTADDAEENAPNLQGFENSLLIEKASSRQHNLIERIEKTYIINRPPAFRAGEQDSEIPHHQLFLQENDFKLWRIKCTPVDRLLLWSIRVLFNICFSPARSTISYMS